MTGDYLKNLRGTVHLRRLATSQGWKEDFNLFVHSNRIYTVDGDYYDVERQDTTFRSKGSAAKWADSTSILNSPGAEAHCLTILLAFAAPLIPFSGLNGITVTPYGVRACYKQFVFNWMTSVWGDPRSLVVAGGEDNASRVERYGRHNNLPLLISEDDLSVAEIGKLSNEFSRGSARAARFGGDGVKPKKWQSILLIPSRESFVERIVADEKKVSFAPVFDYEVPESEEIDSHWKEIHEAMLENHGAAGAHYARWIVMNTDAIRHSLVSVERKLWQIAGVRSDYRSLVAFIACVSVAGTIAKRLDLIKFEHEPAIKMAMDKIRFIFQNLENPTRGQRS